MDLTKMPAFLPNNFRTWYASFHSQLSSDLWDFIDLYGNNENPVLPNHKIEDQYLMRALYKALENAGDEGAASMSIIQPFYDPLAQKCDGISAYRHLLAHFIEHTNVRSDAAMKEYCDCKQKPNEPAQAFYGRLIGLARIAASQGLPFLQDKEHLKSKFRISLLPHYSIVTQIFDKGADQSMDALLKDCLDHENSRPTKTFQTKTAPPQQSDENAELTALRAEVARLNRAVSSNSSRPSKRPQERRFLTYDDLQRDFKDGPAPFEKRYNCDACKMRGHSVRTCLKATAQQKEKYAKKCREKEKNKKSKSD
jgi:hypothetical protein